MNPLITNYMHIYTAKCRACMALSFTRMLSKTLSIPTRVGAHLIWPPTSASVYVWCTVHLYSLNMHWTVLREIPPMSSRTSLQTSWTKSVRPGYTVYHATLIQPACITEEQLTQEIGYPVCPELVPRRKANVPRLELPRTSVESPFAGRYGWEYVCTR